MKVLIAVSCLIAVASAGVLLGHHGGHHGAVIGAHGVPLEPAANVAARAFHHAAHAEATAVHHAAAGHGLYGAGHGAGLYAADAGHLAVAGHLGYAGNLGYAGHHGYAGHYAGPQHLPVIGPNGVPLEPAENVARRAFHHSAHAEASARNGDYAYGHGAHLDYAGHGGHLAYAAHAAPLAYGHHGVAAISHAGVPLDTPEVAAAKAAHFAAHAAASHGHHGHHW